MKPQHELHLSKDSTGLLPVSSQNAVNFINAQDTSDPNIVDDYANHDTSSEADEDFQTGHH